MSHQSKLFNVLVIGGAILGASCGGVGPSGTEHDDAARTDDAAALPDAATSIDAATSPHDAGSSDDAARADDANASRVDAPLTMCGLCPNAGCCETDASGARHTRPGMMCCWGTSC